MTSSALGTGLKRTILLLPILLVLTLGGLLQAQESPYGAPDPSYAQAPPLLSQSQLTDLVAPIALYPDPLLSQILVVSTYPQELMAAEQWLQYNGNLQGPQLMQAAQQQNWDPSIQALVAFPNVMAMLTSDMQWTAELGQVFLAQPTDVMNAIQYLRAQAQSNGQLASTPQLAVNTEYQNGQSAIEIEPTNPQMMYAPAYNPYSVWGPPAEDGGYPALSYAGSMFGSVFSTAINLASMFTGFPGLLGSNGWGWALGWLAQTLFVNNGFLGSFGFLHGLGGSARGSSAWVHDAARGGPAYALNGGNRGAWRFGEGARGFAGGWSRTGSTRQSWPGSGNYHGTNWGTSARNWRNFASNTRGFGYRSEGRFPQTFSPQMPQSTWASNRGYQPYNRYAGSGYGSSAYRAPFTDWRSRPQNYGGFSNYGNRERPAPRDVRQARWNSSRFKQPRMDSHHSFWSRPFSGSPKPPRQEHFKEPHFKAPHFKQPHFSQPHFKSRGSGHFSHGHPGGGRHHR